MKYSTARIKYPPVPMSGDRYILTEIAYGDTFHSELAYDMSVKEQEWMVKQLNSLTPQQVKAAKKYLSYNPAMGFEDMPKTWDKVCEIMMTMTEHQLEAVRIYRAASDGYMDYVLCESSV
jgi:hypothetical protein